ncbi:MAG TPA: hypothetical protein VEP28_10295 [Rubrobacter sp.]|nr:hypothetical protein [Rubrobacter sp.]
MQALRRARTAIFAVTTGLWLFACGIFWRQLVEDAADAGDLYARTSGFQALNFAIQYLWFLLLLLLAILAAEWIVFWVAAKAIARWKRGRLAATL